MDHSGPANPASDLATEPATGPASQQPQLPSPPPSSTAGGERGRLLPFFAAATLLSLPFWALGAAFGTVPGVPIGLPASALMFLCPAVAAVLVTGRRGGRAAVRQLLARMVTFPRPVRLRRYAVAAAFPAAAALAAYPVAGGAPVMPLASAPLLLAVFLVPAAFEELGWTGLATGPLLRRRGPLGAGLLLGAFWGAWHVVPLVQAGHGAVWIAGWFTATVAARLVMMLLYARTGGSIPCAVLLHAAINAAAALLPRYADPRTMAALAAASVLLAAAGFLTARRRSG